MVDHVLGDKKNVISNISPSDGWRTAKEEDVRKNSTFPNSLPLFSTLSNRKKMGKSFVCYRQPLHLFFATCRLILANLPIVCH